MNPNAVIANQNGIYEPIESSDIGLCLHCGRQAVYRKTIDKDIIAFCCLGCEGVYKILKSEHLTKYYDLLHLVNSKAPSQSTDIRSSTVGAKIPLNLDIKQFQHGSSSSSFAIFYPSFNCAACIWLVEHVLKNISGLQGIRVHLEDRKLILQISPENAAVVLSEVLTKLSAVGYQGFAPSNDSNDSLLKSYSKKQLIQLGIAAAIFANVMLFSSSVYLGDLLDGDLPLMRYFNWISLVLATISLATAGSSFFRNVWSIRKTRKVHIDLPIVCAFLVAWMLSVYHLKEGHGDVYFDSITGLVFFLLLGRYLSDSLSSRARQFMSPSNSIIPASVFDAKIGEELEVDQGSMIPADGLLIRGETEVSEASLTGEARPVLKTVGDPVFGGTVNMGSPFRFSVTANGSDTWLAKANALVSEVSTQRGQTDQLADTIARWFIFGTFFSALLAIALWRHTGFSNTFEIVSAVLIVWCPCALAMAIPLANALAIRRLWNHGIVIRNMHAFENAYKVDTIVFDKTGTLTTGKLTITQARLSSQSEIPLGCLRQMTEGSLHPVAKAIHLWSEKVTPVDFETSETFTHPGKGMEILGDLNLRGSTQKVHGYIGSIKWILEQSQDERVKNFLHSRKQDENTLTSAVLLKVSPHAATEEQEIVIEFTFTDEIRQGVPELLHSLRSKGLSTLLLSGDTSKSATNLGSQLGFRTDEIFAEKLPDQKLQFIESKILQGKKVMMMGDGFNDSASLKAATIGVSLNGSMDAAMESSDIFITKTDLEGVRELLDYSAYHRRSIYFILSLSLFYNLVAVTLALLNLIHPFTAALIMPLSSLNVLFIAWMRKANSIWKPSTLSCPLR